MPSIKATTDDVTLKTGDWHLESPCCGCSATKLCERVIILARQKKKATSIKVIETYIVGKSSSAPQNVMWPIITTDITG